MRAFSKKIGVAGAAAGFVLLPLYGAAESGWRLSGTASQNISASENGVSSLTSIGLNALTQTERMRFGINTGFGLAASTGDGVNAVLPNFGLNFGIDGKRWTINSNASINFTPITFDLEDETDLTTTEETGIRRSIGASVRGSYELTPRSTASLTYSYSDLDYSESSTTLVPSQTHNITGSLAYEAAQDTSVTASIGARWFDADNTMNSSSFTLDTNVGVSYEATSRLSLNAGAGITWAKSKDDFVGLRQETTSTAFLLNGGLSYGLRDGTLRLNLSQRVAPEAGSGELTRFNTATLGYTHQVNQRTAIGIDLSASDQKTIPTGTSISQVSISPFLTWEIAEDLQARVGYSLRDRDGDISHRATFFVQKSFESGF